MTYICWAALYEGATDRVYFDVLLPRAMEDITLKIGSHPCVVPPNPAVVLKRDTTEKVAKEACAAKDAFHIVFIHSDDGGRELQANLKARTCSYCDAMYKACDLPIERCVIIAPRHEVEAWLLSDPFAVTAALGYNGTPASLGLPTNVSEAEKLVDPKKILADAVQQVRGARRELNTTQLYPAIAQRQSLDRLRGSMSFRKFEAGLKNALVHLGCVARD